jgi:hypothetical protein
MSDTGFLTRALPWICATLATAFHVLVVVTPLVATQGRGEGQAFAVALVDFPLVMLLKALPYGGYVLYDSAVAYLWFFSIVGTLMHAAIGYCVGVLLKALVAR